MVNSNDLAELRDKKIVFDFEFRCSTQLAKDDQNVRKTMETAFERALELQEKRR